MDKKKLPLRGFVPPHTVTDCSPNASVLVAFSGGPDSRTLLDLLVTDAQQKGYPLYAAHLNHGIRGEEADRDEEFCKQVADAYGIELFCHRADVPALAKETGQSVETAARNARYAFFTQLMQEHHIPILVTAHNADDNLETMLLDLIRGCGLDGLCGIPPVRAVTGGTLVRPLLSCTRDDILAYCQANSLDFVTDSTNTDTQYTRNRIRAEVIPALQAIHPAIVDASIRTCDVLRADAEHLRQEAEALLAWHRLGFSLPTSTVCEAPRPIAARALMLMFREFTDGVALEQCHVQSLLSLCERATPHARVDLPHDCIAVIEDGKLCLMYRKDYPAPAPQAYEVTLQPGENHISQTNCEIVIGNSQNPKNIYKYAIRMYFNTDKIVGNIIARNRRPGDKIRYLGVNKDVRRLMSEKKLPPFLRGCIPVLCDGRGVLAIPSVATRDDVFVANDRFDPTQHLIIDCYICKKTGKANSYDQRH